MITKICLVFFAEKKNRFGNKIKNIKLKKIIRYKNTAHMNIWCGCTLHIAVITIEIKHYYDEKLLFSSVFHPICKLLTKYQGKQKLTRFF